MGTSAETAIVDPKEKKLLFSVSVCSKQTEVCRVQKTKRKLPFSVCSVSDRENMETWRRRHGDMEMETWKHGDIDMETWKQGEMEKWKNGEIEIWRHKDMKTCRHGDMETWRHGEMEIWRHGDMDMETSVHQNKNGSPGHYPPPLSVYAVRSS